MPNVIRLSPAQLPELENPDDILNAGDYGAGALIRLQTSATQAGAFADVSGAGSTPTTLVITGTRKYTGFDPSGIASSWYRARVENAGATRLGDWAAAFQVAGEGAGYICGLDDVKQKLGATDTVDDEDLIDFIVAVTDLIVSRTGRRFVRTPLSGSTTFLFDVREMTRTLRVPGGIASLTQLEVATQTGGTFSIVPTADWFIRPRSTDSNYIGAPTRIELSDRPTGSFPFFYPGLDVVRGTGALGFPVVPPYVANLAANAVARMFLAKQSGSSGPDLVLGTPEFGQRVLAAMSPSERAWLDEIAVRPI